MAALRSPEDILPAPEAAGGAAAVPIRLVDPARWQALDAEGLSALAGDAAADADAVRRLAAIHGFAAAPGAVLVVPGRDGLPAAALAGRPEKALDCWTAAAIAAALPEGSYRFADPLDDEQQAAAALGFALEGYRFSLAAEPKPPALRRLLVGEKPRRRALAEARAVFRVRDLVNLPANRLGPQRLAAEVEALAARHGAAVEIWRGDALIEKGFPAVHAVGAAGHEPPHVISLTWGAEDAPRLALVGKGVCFDSGGLDIKSAQGMRLMKKDMGGAAHALALAALVMEHGLPVRLHLVIPAVYNAVDARAYRPGDVIATRKGLQVEIGNTDAEGRLILADALAFADESAPELLIDFATLTGAARVALGPDLPALFTRDDALAAALEEAGRREADPLWRLPIHDPYAEDLGSEIADLSNIASHGFAGAIIAALFLDRFVGRAGAHAHLDIYAWNGKARPGRPAGGEAFALRAVFAVLRARWPGG
ncbi:MAG: cytosol aminopeptidase [Rhodothalassiaceae bacterium]|nr:MAG: cytosol aminopeptidase [Rhodothalassiaceae bacterium]